MPDYKISIIVDGKDLASKPLSNVSNALGNMATIAGGIQLSKVFDSIVGGVSRIGSSAINAAADFQNLGIAMNTLATRELIRGGASISEAMAQAGDMADGFMKKLQDISLISPYEWATVSDVSRLQMAFGATGDMALDLTAAILDTSAGLGLTNEAAGRLAYNFGQIRSIGKITGLDLKQLKMVGLDMADVFQTQLGASVETVNAALESGRITMDDVSNAFMQYAKENFGGAAERMSRTFTGIQSSFSDLFTFAAKDLLTPALNIVSDRLATLFDNLRVITQSGLFAQIGEELGTFVSDTISWIEQLGARVGQEGIVGVLGLDPEMVRQFIGVAGDLANILQENVGIAIEFVKDHINEFKGALIGVGIVLAAGAVIGGILALVAAIASLASPIGLIIGAAALLGAAWAGNWGDIQGITAQAVEYIQGAIRQLEVIVHDVLSRLNQWWSEHGQHVENITGQIGSAVDSFWNYMSSDAGPQDTGSRWNELWNGILFIVSEKLSSIIQIADSSLEILGGVIDTFSNVLSGNWTAAWESLKGTAEAVLNSLVANISFMLPGIVPIVSMAFSQIGPAISEKAAEISAAVSGLVQQAKEAISTLPFHLQIIGQSAVNSLRAAISDNNPVIERITGIVTSIKAEISKLPSDMVKIGGDIVGGLVQGIKDSAGSVLDTIKQFITDPMPDWLKGPLGISSPSVVFEGIGFNLIEGLIFGIDQQQPNLLAKMKEVETTMSDSGDRLAGLKGKLTGGGGPSQKVLKALQSGVGGVLGAPSGNDFIRANLEGTSQATGNAYDEMARRMADIQARGKESPWYSFFSDMGEIPADIADEGGNTLQAFAMNWQDQFYQGLKPDMVDMAAAVDQYRQQLEGQLAQQQLTQQVSQLAMQDPAIMGMLSQLQGVSPLGTLGQDATTLSTMLPTLNPMLQETMGLATGGMAAMGEGAGVGGAVEGALSPLAQMGTDVTNLSVTVPALNTVFNTLWSTIEGKLNAAVAILNKYLGTEIPTSTMTAKPKIDSLTKGVGSLASAVDDLNTKLQTLISLLEKLGQMDLGILQPGSPTPFEIGLRGINRELGRLGINDISPLNMGAGGGRPIEVHLHAGVFMGTESEAREWALKVVPILQEVSPTYGAI